MAVLFNNIPNCKVITSDFPVGTISKFKRKDFELFLRALYEVRNEMPTHLVDYIGDFREKLVLRLIGKGDIIQIGWEKGHPFNRIIRNPIGQGERYIKISKTIPNVYESYEIFTDTIIKHLGICVEDVERVGWAYNFDYVRVIGLHPFASQKCKEWPVENWKALARILLSKGIEVVVFGGQSDLINMKEIFYEFGEKVRLICGDVMMFSSELKKLDLLIGLDSFGVHMAEYSMVPSIMLNGANNKDLYSPPHATVIYSSGGCKYWPCYNKPSCSGNNKYICIKSISVSSVLNEIVKRI